jgi:hypothetical protein
LGIWSVVIQATLFIGLLFISQPFSWQMTPLIIFCPLSGFIAYRSQSIWYSLAASWLIIFLTDVFFLVYR